MIEYQIELAKYNDEMEKYNQKQQDYKSSTTRKIGSLLGKKAYNPENYKPALPPQKPIWAPPNIVKYPVAPS